MRQNLWPNALAKLCGAALGQLFHFHHGQYPVPDPEAEVPAAEGRAVEPVGVVLVGGSGVLGEDLLHRRFRCSNCSRSLLW